MVQFVCLRVIVVLCVVVVASLVVSPSTVDRLKKLLSETTVMCPVRLTLLIHLLVADLATEFYYLCSCAVKYIYIYFFFILRS